jgi:alpha-tubulin suppressor-like RCC1 family protein
MSGLFSRVIKSRRLFLIVGISLLLSNTAIYTASSNEPVKTTFTSVSSGDHFSCGLTDKGIVYCWGANERSQLGTSDRIRNLIPIKVYEVNNVVEIAAGSDFACARISDGGVACWGRGDLGQTGDGFEETKDRIFATRVPTISTAIGITAGNGHACALLKDKSIQCWGSNDFWQLGNSTSTLEKLPIKVTGIPTIKQVAAGYNHTCALAESGFIYCWGDNRFGQLGNGNKNIFKAVPNLVLGISDVKLLQLGANTSCAITTTPETKCWGWGRDGQLTSSEIANQYFPSTTSLNNLTSISPGRTKACGIFNAANSSLLYCWGTLIGTYPATGPASLSVSLGYDHGCAVTTLGFIQCFGWNHKGQLGTGVTSIGVSKIDTVSLLSFPDWQYYVNSWTISYENDLAIMTWIGGVPRYRVRIEGSGIACEDLVFTTCKFGPLKSNTTYKGDITAKNTGGVSPYIGVSAFEFTTGTLVSALDQYSIDQAATAKIASEKLAAAAKIEKEKADLVKAEEFIASLSKQIDLALKVESSAQVNFVRDVVVSNKYLAILEAADANVAKTTTEIKKMMAVVQSLVLRIIKKIGT